MWTAVCSWFAGLLYYLLLGLCVMCLSKGTFLFLCVNFVFLFFVISEALSFQMDNRRKRATKARLRQSSAALSWGLNRHPPAPMLTQYKATGGVVRWACCLHWAVTLAVFLCETSEVTQKKEKFAHPQDHYNHISSFSPSPPNINDHVFLCDIYWGLLDYDDLQFLY